MDAVAIGFGIAVGMALAVGVEVSVDIVFAVAGHFDVLDNIESTFSFLSSWQQKSCLLHGSFFFFFFFFFFEAPCSTGSGVVSSVFETVGQLTNEVRSTEGCV